MGYIYFYSLVIQFTKGFRFLFEIKYLKLNKFTKVLNNLFIF